jgi:hypothetical protein
MIIYINNWGTISYDEYRFDYELGLKYIAKESSVFGDDLYEIVNEPLFMLAIIKHNIQYRFIGG